MRTALSILVVAIFLTITPTPCVAMWDIAPVSTERAKELGIGIRSTAAGPNLVRVELEFQAKGELKNFTEDPYGNYGRVELRVGQGDHPAVTAPLREDRSKPGRVVVSFTADRAQLDKLTLWVMVPGSLGGTAYELRVKDFVEPKKVR